MNTNVYGRAGRQLAAPSGSRSTPNYGEWVSVSTKINKTNTSPHVSNCKNSNKSATCFFFLSVHILKSLRGGFFVFDIYIFLN